MSAPHYMRIADSLRRQIESGHLVPGARLPTEDALITQFDKSRGTVRAAMRELQQQGLVDTQHGKGTFVADRVEPVTTTLTWDPQGSGTGGGEGQFYDAEVARAGRQPKATDFRVEIVVAHPDLADALKIAIDSDVIGRYERRYVDDIPWSLQTSYYPRTLTQSAPALEIPRSIESGTVAYLREHGIDQVGYRDSLKIRQAYPVERDFFGLLDATSMLVTEISRVAFDQDLQPMRQTITVYLATRNRFVIEVGQVPPAPQVAS
jgi:GntR family transcriptional regulator